MKVLVLAKRAYTNKDLVADRYGRVWELASRLTDHGHVVRGVAFDYRRGASAESPPDAGAPAWDTLNLFPNPLIAMRRYLRHVDALVRDFCPDVILSVSDVYHVIFADRVARRHGIRHVVDLYDDYACFRAARVPGARTLYRRSLARADGIVCVSRALASHVAEEVAPRADPVVIVNGVDTEMFSPQDRLRCRQELGLPADRLLVGLGGALCPDRGIHTMLDAHRRLVVGGVDADLVLAGARSSGLEMPARPDVHDLGELDYARMPVFFSALDAGVIVNRAGDFARYCFPQKFFEMLACGTPPVVAAIGDVEALMQSCPQGLFAADDVNALERALASQLGNPCLPAVKPVDWATQAAGFARYLEDVRADTRPKDRAR